MREFKELFEIITGGINLDMCTKVYKEDELMRRACVFLEQELMSKEYEAITYLYGLDIHRPHVSSQTMEANATSAIRKLRHPVRTRKFVNSLDIAAIKKNNNIDLNNVVEVSSFPKIVDKATTINELDFSIRTHNVLKRHGVDTVYQLYNLSFEELRHIKNLGNKSFKEILKKISLIEEVNW